MTLSEAIEEVKRASKNEGTWDNVKYNRAVLTILSAVVKGELKE